MPKQITEITVYDMKGAARYCGLSLGAIRQHYFKTGDLHGIKKGHAIIFTQQQLDAFLAVKRKPGRPFAEDAR